MKDLFEDVRDALGCMYISDIRAEKYASGALYQASHFCVSEYSLNQWDDFAAYLFGDEQHFNSFAQVFEYLNSKKG